MRITFQFSMLFLIVISCSKNDYNNAVFWKVKHPESKMSSHILGTVHIIDTNFINFPKTYFKSIIKASDIVCTEVIPEQFEELDRNTPNFFVSTESQYISKTLDKEYYQKLYQIVESSHYGLYDWLPYLDSLSPSKITQLLMWDRPMMRSDLFKDYNYSPEQDFIAFAKINRIEIFPLESTKHWKSYDSLFVGEKNTYQKNLENLKYAIDIYNEDYEDIYQLYLKQNLSSDNLEMYKDSLMIIRNQRMTQKIDSIISKKKAFIAVGAAHLPYENGMLNLLYEKGYVIEPIAINFN